jgi:pantoate kinase
MKEAKAFSPCHITGFFQIFDKPTDPLRVGSRGAGISLTTGVTTKVKIKESTKNSIKIKINAVTPTSADVSEQVTNILLAEYRQSEKLTISIEHYVDVPVGAGFGTSGAAALSLALALNEALGLNLSKIEAAQVAHTVEIKCKTGLGTVIAETFGGFEIRTKPGAPGIGEIKYMKSPKEMAVCCMAFGSLSTKKLLTDPETRKRINEFGGKLVDQLIEKPDLVNFLKLSRQFAEHVGLISKKVRKILSATDHAGFVCSMPMFGEAVFTLVERKSLEELLEILGKAGTNGQIITSSIDFEGARILK